LQELKIIEYSLHIKVRRTLLIICSHIGRCRRMQLRRFWRPSWSRIIVFCISCVFCIKHSDPQSAYALHILNNKHEYGSTKDTVTLLKHIEKPSLLIPYEQVYIQSYYYNNQLILEQHSNEQKPLYQQIDNRHNTSHPTWPLIQYLNSNTINQFHPNPADRQSTEKERPPNN
jgi:hypothetical protein